MYNTKQKQMIIEIFKNNPSSLFQIKDILILLENKVSRATLYRQLDNLYNDKIINRFYNKEFDCYEYQYIASNECFTHIHLKCLTCGKIIHLKCKEASNLLEHINLEHGFVVSNNQTVIYGTCKNCLRRLI